MAKKMIRLLSAALVLLLILPSCSDGYKTDQTFRYILTQSVTSLDPQTAKTEGERIVINHLFEGLCRLDDTGQTIPGAAKKWKANNDNTVFTFTLRKNACWNDGTPMTADDFYFGIMRALNPDTGASMLEDLFLIKNASLYNMGQASEEDVGIKVIDNENIEFTLEAGYKDFPSLTAGTRFMPCNREFFEFTMGKYGIDGSNTLTNGPFNFETEFTWEKNQYIYIQRASKYNGPNVSQPLRVEFLLEDRDDTYENKLASVISGSLDITELDESDVEYAKANKMTVKTLNDSVCGLLLNTEDDLLKNKPVRQVFMSTIDRQSVLSRFEQEITEARGIVPMCVKWDERTYRDLSENMYAPYDGEIVSEIPDILESFEIESAVIPTITVICPDDELSKNLSTGIVKSWNSHLSNSFNLEPLSTDEFYTRLADKNFQAALCYVSSDGVTPNSFFNKFTSKAVPTLMENPVYDEMLISGNFSIERYKELEEFIKDEYVFYPFYYSYSHYAVNRKSNGIIASPDLGVNFIWAKKHD